MGAGDRGTGQCTGTRQQEGKRRDDLWRCRHTQPLVLEHGACAELVDKVPAQNRAAILGRGVAPRGRNSTCPAAELSSCPGEQTLERIPAAQNAVPHALRGTRMPRPHTQPTLPARILPGRWHDLCHCHHPGCHYPHPITSGSSVSYLVPRDNFPKSFTTSPLIPCPTPGLAPSWQSLPSPGHCEVPSGDEVTAPASAPHSRPAGVAGPSEKGGSSRGRLGPPPQARAAASGSLPLPPCPRGAPPAAGAPPTALRLHRAWLRFTAASPSPKAPAAASPRPRRPSAPSAHRARPGRPRRTGPRSLLRPPHRAPRPCIHPIALGPARRPPRPAAPRLRSPGPQPRALPAASPSVPRPCPAQPGPATAAAPRTSGRRAPGARCRAPALPAAQPARMARRLGPPGSVSVPVPVPVPLPLRPQPRLMAPPRSPHRWNRPRRAAPPPPRGADGRARRLLP